MLRSLRQCPRIVNSSFNLMLPRAGFASQTLIRHPIREVNEKGKPFLYPDHVARIERDPKPVSDAAKKQRRITKRPETESIGDANLAHSFINQINRITSKKTPHLLVLEGERLISDAVDAGLEIKQIYYTHQRVLKACPDIQKLITPQNKDIKCHQVKEADMKLVSQVTTPPGVIAVFKKPTDKDIRDLRGMHIDSSMLMPVTVIADAIKDPGNMGGLIRSSAAAGIQDIITTNGSIDVWNQKVVRTGMGCHFRIPLTTGMEITDLRERILPSLESVFYAEAADSENTAGTDCKDYYFNCDFFPPPPSKPLKTALFVGGEAFGLSPDMKQLLTELKAKKLVIPMMPDIDSLNSYVAATIILFEMRKQFLKATMTT